MINVVEKTRINALKTCGVDHNKAFIKGAVRSALNCSLLSIVEDESKIWKSLKAAIVQVATSVEVISRSAESLRNFAVRAQISKFAVEAVRSEDTTSVRNFVVVAPPSYPILKPKSKSDEEKKERRKKRSKNRYQPRSTSSFLFGKGT